MRCLAAIAVVLLLATAPAAAQPPGETRPRPVLENGTDRDDAESRQDDEGGPGPAAGPRALVRRERLRERIRAMRAWYLTEQLSLDDATAGRLFPLLGRFDDRMEELHQRGVLLHRALKREMAAAPPNRAALNQLVNDLLAHYEDLYRVQRDRFAAVRKVVTPEQSAKLLLVLPQIDDAIRRQIQRVVRRQKNRDGLRKNRARRQGPAPPDPSAPPFGDHF
jgi:hypothetical protein